MWKEQSCWASINTLCDWHSCFAVWLQSSQECAGSNSADKGWVRPEQQLLNQLIMMISPARPPLRHAAQQPTCAAVHSPLAADVGTTQEAQAVWVTLTPLPVAQHCCCHLAQLTVVVVVVVVSGQVILVVLRLLVWLQPAAAVRGRRAPVQLLVVPTAAGATPHARGPPQRPGPPPTHSEQSIAPHYSAQRTWYSTGQQVTQDNQTCNNNGMKIMRLLQNTLPSATTRNICKLNTFYSHRTETGSTIVVTVFTTRPYVPLPPAFTPDGAMPCARCWTRV